MWPSNVTSSALTSALSTAEWRAPISLKAPSASSRKPGSSSTSSIRNLALSATAPSRSDSAYALRCSATACSLLATARSLRRSRNQTAITARLRSVTAAANSLHAASRSCRSRSCRAVASVRCDTVCWNRNVLNEPSRVPATAIRLATTVLIRKIEHNQTARSICALPSPSPSLDKPLLEPRLSSPLSRSGTFRAHHTANCPEPTRTAEISAAGQATCRVHLRWSRRPTQDPAYRPPSPRDAPLTCVAWPRLRLPGHLLQSIRAGVVCTKPHG